MSDLNLTTGFYLVAVGSVVAGSLAVVSVATGSVGGSGWFMGIEMKGSILVNSYFVTVFVIGE